MSNIQVTITVDVDGDQRSWSATTTTDLNPYGIADSTISGVRVQASQDLGRAASRAESFVPVLG